MESVRVRLLELVIAGAFKSERAPSAMGRKKKQQKTLSQVGMYLALQQPDSVLGEALKVPGTLWNWGTGADAKAKAEADYLCSIIKFEALHRWPTDAPSAAFQVQDPEVQDDNSHKTFWVKYPNPFLAPVLVLLPSQARRAQAAATTTE